VFHSQAIRQGTFVVLMSQTTAPQRRFFPQKNRRRVSMRRFFLGMAIASLTAGAPLTAFGGDREIADAIVSTLKQKQTDGTLKGFDIDLSVEDGKVVIGGTVANQAQLDSVLHVASITTGVKLVENKASVRETTAAVSPTRKALPKHGPMTQPNPDVVPASASDDVPSLLTEPTRFVAGGETTASPADVNVTSDVLGRLGKAQAEGRLRNFEIDVSTVDGEVLTRGYVATPEQKQLVLGTIQRTPGVRKVIDDVTVTGTVRRASNEVAAPAAIPSAMPVVGSGAPRAFAPSALANGSMGGVPMQGGAMAPMPMQGGAMAPVPMQGGPSYGGGVPRYDQPNMPNYAWPSYAAAPNYAAVTYPKQYSASAWPYIGPFYPYPQVPLGWRKVALEWDDGLWYLDFTSKK
jgi:osmotically-inducible protein OsmY